MDWKKIEASPLAPYFQKMSETPQEIEWHGEGDVMKPTRRVCEQHVKLEAWYWRRKKYECFP